MKAYIFKTASGEYSSYEECVKEVFLVDDSTPSISELEVEFGTFILEERRKARASSIRWTAKYVKENGFLFEDWFKNNYNCTSIIFSEHINYE